MLSHPYACPLADRSHPSPRLDHEADRRRPVRAAGRVARRSRTRIAVPAAAFAHNLPSASATKTIHRCRHHETQQLFRSRQAASCRVRSVISCANTNTPITLPFVSRYGTLSVCTQRFHRSPFDTAQRYRVSPDLTRSLQIVLMIPLGLLRIKLIGVTPFNLGDGFVQGLGGTAIRAQNTIVRILYQTMAGIKSKRTCCSICCWSRRASASFAP